MDILLQVEGEKLKYYSTKPFITSGDSNVHTCQVFFDITWYGTDYTAPRYLYVLRNDKIIDIQQLVNNRCTFGNEVFKEPGVIQFCVIRVSGENILTTSRLDLEIYEGVDKSDIVAYPTITLYRGGTSTITFDFTDFNFSNGTVELTIKRKINTNTLFTYEFDENKEYEVTFSSDFTSGLSYSDYLYDLVYIINSERYPLCIPSPIKVKGMINNG